MLDIDIEKCTSCGACIQICPKDAIILKKEISLGGAMRPTINKDKCINCHLCEKVCQINKKLSFKNERKIYSGWIGIDKRRESSSGGIGYILAKRCFENGFKVFGSIYDRNLKKVVNKELRNSDDLYKSKGSKYVLSESMMVYEEIKNYLVSGKNVLYISTPCQIEGLYLFLGKDYSNLFTVDLICHGVCSSENLKEEIEYFEKKNNIVIDNIAFRGEKSFRLRFFKDNNTVFCKRATANAYFYSFLKGITLQANCYNCKYATISRISDVTIGDFIGYKKYYAKGINEPSIVLINSKNGYSLISYIKDDLEHFTEENENITKDCVSLYAPFPKHKLYQKFIHQYSKNTSFHNTIHKLVGIRLFFATIKFYFLAICRKVIKTIVRK